MVVNPLQWQVGHATTPDGCKVCFLALGQGNLQIKVDLAPDDMEKAARSMLDAASQARSGLIIPAGPVNLPAPNGKGH